MAYITLTLIAHDAHKDAMAHFVLEHRSEFSKFHLMATQGTGQLVQKRTGLKVHLLKPDLEGGAQIARLVVDAQVHAVIFFHDLVAPEPHEPNFLELLQVCDLREIPLATNPATAQALLFFLLHSPNRGVVTARPWAFESSPA